MKLFLDFHNAILANDAEQITPAIKPHSRLTGEQQFAVYSDGYRIRLVNAIRSDYPILLNLLGEGAFDAFARAYIDQYPPTSYNLDSYPHKFAEFLSKNFDDNFAIDLAILEATIAEVFMLPDSEPLFPESVSEISAEDFGEMTLKLRTACRLLRFNHQVSDWLTLARAGNNPPLPPSKPSCLLVVRHNNEVQRHNLSEQEFSLLQNLASGKNVSDALDITLDEYESDAEIIINNLQRWFVNWVTNGVFSV